MEVPFLNLKLLHEEHREEFHGAIQNVLENTDFIGGDTLGMFEGRFARWVGEGMHAVGCGNGTDAITLAASALELPRGSVAVVPAMTYIATAEALLNAGLSLRLVDVEEGTWLIDPKKLEGIPDAKLVVPVHLYGQMAEMDALRRLADEKGWRILEDAAQAHGAAFRGKSVGFFGDIATYSFYPGKNLGAFGDAGAVLSRSENLIERCRQLGNHGSLEKYRHDRSGYCSRLDGIQAAVLNVKLKYIDRWNVKRADIAKFYLEALQGIEGLQLPVRRPDRTHAWHLFVVLVDNREDFLGFLSDKGIGYGLHYPRAIHQLDAFREQFKGQRFPQAERLAQRGVSLPMCPTLNGDQLNHVVSSIKRYFQ